jgi:hypothetical protein
VETWEDVAAHPTDRETARRMGDDADSHGQGDVVTHTEDERKVGANLAFVRALEGVRDHLRTNVATTYPDLATPDLCRRVRAIKQEINDILVVLS